MASLSEKPKIPNFHYSRGGRRIRLKGLVHVALALGGIIWFLHSLFNYCRCQKPFEYHITYMYGLTGSIATTPGSGSNVPQPIIGKVTMLYGNNSVYERAFRTHEEHSRRLGYPLLALRNPVLDGVWNKYFSLLSALMQELEKPADRRLQWLFWFDGDTILMNPNMPLETFLPPPRFSDIHMLLTEDWNGMNNGVFFIRVHPWSVELLSAAIGYPAMNPDVDLYWQDQSALMNIFKDSKYFSAPVQYCPSRWFNAYMRSKDGRSPNPDSPRRYQVSPGDLLVHFPGTQKDDLNTTLGPYMDIAEAHEAEWEPQLKETGYIQETEKFWNNVNRTPNVDEHSDSTG